MGTACKPFRHNFKKFIKENAFTVFNSPNEQDT